jgi:hypothetical protein
MPRPYARGECSLERIQPSNVTPDSETMNIFSPFVGIYRLEIQHVANYRVLVGDAVGAKDVTGQA